MEYFISKIIEYYNLLAHMPYFKNQEGYNLYYENINPDTLEAAFYIIAFFVPLEGIIKDNDDFETKLNDWYAERDKIG
ncbi:MAG: hypothetical protein ACFFKA_15930, partial [Candidatus Thorarchaeota archaeon]